MTKNHVSQSHTEEDLGTAAKTAVKDLQAIEDRFQFSEALTPVQRRQLHSVAGAYSEDVLTRVVELAARHDGSIAGVPFDPAGAQTSLGEAKALRTLANAGHTFVRRLEDEALRREAGVSEQSTAVLIALRGLVRTPQGQALKQEVTEIMSAKRAVRRKRRSPAAPKAPKQAKSPAKAPVEQPKAPSPTPPVPLANGAGGNQTEASP